MQKYANLVELEKCCQTHIFLQNFVLIQPRTSPPKNCKFLINSNFANFPNFANPRYFPRVIGMECSVGQEDEPFKEFSGFTSQECKEQCSIELSLDPNQVSSPEVPDSDGIQETKLNKKSNR